MQVTTKMLVRQLIDDYDEIYKDAIFSNDKQPLTRVEKVIKYRNIKKLINRIYKEL